MNFDLRSAKEVAGVWEWQRVFLEAVWVILLGLVKDFLQRPTCEINWPK